MSFKLIGVLNCGGKHLFRRPSGLELPFWFGDPNDILLEAGELQSVLNIAVT